MSEILESANDKKTPLNFIEQIIEEDIKNKKNGGKNYYTFSTGT